MAPAHQSLNEPDAAGSTAESRLSILLRAGADIQLAGSEQDAIRIIADAVHRAGWGAVAVNLFDENWNITLDAYAGMTDRRIADLRSRRVEPSDRAAMFGPRREPFRISRSYFIPAEVASEVVLSPSVMPGAREPQPGDTWDPNDFAYTPLVDRAGNVIGRITYDDPENGQRPDEATFRYLEAFADLAAWSIESRRLLMREQRITADLQRREAQLRILHEHIPDELLFLDTDANILWINRIPENVPLTMDRVVGASMLDFIPEHEHDEYMTAFREAVNERRAQETTVSSLIEGKRLYWKKRLVPVEREGAVQQVLEIATDVTEDRLHDAARRESETRLRLALQASGLGLWDWRPDKGEVFTDDNFLRMFGYEPGDLPPQVEHWRALVHPDDLGKVRRVMRDHLEGRNTLGDIELRIRSKQGEWRWARVLGSRVDSGESEGTRVIGTCQDVTEEKLGRQHLAIAEFTIETSTDPVFWAEFDGRIAYVNVAACRELGYTREELTSMSIPDVDPNMRPADAFNRTINEIRRTGMVQMESCLQRKDGSTFPMEVKAHRVDFEGRELICAFTRDLTQQKRAEDSLRATNTRQRLLLRELNHRTKNIFGALLALIDLHATKEQDVGSFADSIRARVKAMADIHNMLSASKWQSLDISAIIRSMIPVGMESRMSIEGPEVHINPRQATPLGIVLQELFSNALKYGALSVPDGRVAVSWQTTGATDPTSAQPVRIWWRERNGPRINRPPTPGLGTSLISGFARSELRGQVRFTFEPDGAAHLLEITLDRAEQAPSR